MNKKIKPTMSVKEINAALKNGGTFTFEPGTYSLTDTIMLRNNTTVVCDEGCVFDKKVKDKPAIATYAAATTKVFKGVHDVSWKGGTFKGTKTSQVSMFRLFHAQNIEISGVTVKSCGCVHYVEVNACKNVAIVSCSFEGHILAAGKKYKEIVQIDYAYYDGIPDAAAKGSACFDNTHCRDIKVIECAFLHCPTCIGSHKAFADGKYHKGITVSLCTAIGTDEGNFMNVLNMRDVSITQNTAQKFGSFVRLKKQNTATIDNNSVKDIKQMIEVV